MLNQNLLLTGDDAYNLTNSLRFRSSASAYLNRTFSTGNRKIFTWSGWVKRGSLTGNQVLISPYTNSTGTGTYGAFRFVDGSIEFFDYTNGTYNAYFYTSSSQYTFRDPASWYHIVLAVDTTQATGSNRIKIYVNGTQITGTFYATPTQNYDLQWNNNLVNYIGYTPVASQYFDGYLAEVNFIDGQALTPSSFGATNPATGVWQPAKYTGTYGTNGFYLPFTDNSALTTSSNAGLGKDFSGNGNYWTTNNISITSGSTYDSMTDVPTLTNATTANYCVLNPIASAVADTYSQANLRWTKVVNTTNTTSVGSIAISSGKWYWEGTVAAAGGSNIIIGIGNTDTSFVNLDSNLGMTGSTTSYAYNGLGLKQNNNSQPSYGATFTTNDVIGVAFDADAGTLTFYKNNTSQGTAYTGITGTYYPACGGRLSNDSWYMNFGQRPFAYTPPSGFVALNTFNLPTPTIGATASTQANKYMDATLYTGNGSTLNVVNAGGFAPDLVWTKERSGSGNHMLGDILRGTNNTLFSNNTLAVYTDRGVDSFNSNGFTYSGTEGGDGNVNGSTYVAWQWKANGSGSSNTSGSITSTVSANTSAGFSIVTYTGTGSNATVGHGLGVAPKLIIGKKRSSTGSWQTYVAAITNMAGGYIVLNGTGGWTANTTIWNNTAPTSSVFSLGTDTDLNASGATNVAYCWAEIAGYSAFGSYTGNGSSDGTFVYTGFRPKFVLLKCSSSADNWSINDSARDTYNAWQYRLYPDLSNAENAGGAGDFLSNGFKLRSSSQNTNGATYIYMAFAENPFKYSLAR